MLYNLLPGTSAYRLDASGRYNLLGLLNLNKVNVRHVMMKIINAKLEIIVAIGAYTRQSLVAFTAEQVRRFLLIFTWSANKRE